MNEHFYCAIIAAGTASLTTLMFHIISMRVLRRQVIKGIEEGTEKAKAIMALNIRQELQKYINWQYQRGLSVPDAEDLQADKEALDDYIEYRTSAKN
jgi:hypothetical protein